MIRTMIQTWEPSVEILDVRMPKQDGLGVLRALKEDSATCDLPVMMLTGERDDATVMDAVGAGAADYMVKPFHPDRLMERVARIIATARPAASPVWEI